MTGRLVRALLLPSLLCLASTGCSDDGVVGVMGLDGGTTEGGPTVDGGERGDGGDAGESGDGGSSPDDGGRAAYCMGSGPPVSVGEVSDGGAATETCGGRIAEGLFRHALCSCDGLLVSNPFTTDAFDSDMGPYMTGETGGAVGINVDYRNTGSGDIGGTLSVSGVAGMEVTNPHVIRGDLFINGPLQASGYVDAQRDAWIRGDIVADNDMDVGRDLVHPDGITTTGTITVTGAERTADFTVDPPCACDPEELLDVRALALEAEVHNDNAEIDLDPALLDRPDSDVELTLPCGRFYFDAIRATKPVVLNVEGRVALFVGGDVEVSNAVTVNVADDAELDLFIAGSVVAGNPLQLGSAERPKAVRVYVGGPSVRMTGSATFTGNLYAPHALVYASNPLEVFGSVFAGDFEATNTVTIHYDRAILHAGESCDDVPDDGCSTCGDCRSTQACVDGMCGACTTDADCCSPLVCDPATGTCGSLLF